MKKNKKSTLISKPDIMPCWRCEATGKENGRNCPLCKGLGKWIENHYIVIDNKNNIAIDSDTGG
jgi:DnaJ-class molecular chaperone